MILERYFERYRRFEDSVHSVLDNERGGQEQRVCNRKRLTWSQYVVLHLYQHYYYSFLCLKQQLWALSY